jgi:paraquat-inducible protein A
MSDSPASPADRLILPLLLLASVALVLGVFLPVVEVSNMVIFSNRFSILEAAQQLLSEGEVLLGIVVIVFSVVFPAGKIAAALVVFWRIRTTGGPPDGWLDRLEFFGRWSCADVLIVAIAIVVTKSTGIADASMAIGLWFFAGSVLLTAIGVHRLRKIV